MPDHVVCAFILQTGKFSHNSQHPVILNISNRRAQLIAFLLRPCARHRQLSREIAAMRLELAALSPATEYTKCVKLERRILAAQSEQNNLGTSDATRQLIVRYAVPYGSQLLLSLVLVAISILYRYVPVVVFGDRYNFAPFSWLMGFPTGVTGAVSVPFWIFVSSFVAKSVASLCGQ